MLEMFRARGLTTWALLAVMGWGLMAPAVAYAQEEAAAPASSQYEDAYSSEEYVGSEGYAVFAVNNLWICISAFGSIIASWKM